MHAKYEASISYASKGMTKVKVFLPQSNRQAEKQDVPEFRYRYKKYDFLMCLAVCLQYITWLILHSKIKDVALI